MAFLLPAALVAGEGAGAAAAGAAAGSAVSAGVGATAASSIPWMGILSGISGAGTLMNAFGQYQAGQDAKAMGEYNEQVAAQEAETIRRKTAYDVQIQKEKARRLMSYQRLAYAKSGVDISEGTALDTLLQQVKDAEMDTLATEYTGDIAASRALAKGGAYGYQGSQAATAGKIGALGSIIKGAGDIGYMYGRGKLRLRDYE